MSFFEISLLIQNHGLTCIFPCSGHGIDKRNIKIGFLFNIEILLEVAVRTVNPPGQINQFSPINYLCQLLARYKT